MLELKGPYIVGNMKYILENIKTDCFIYTGKEYMFEFDIQEDIDNELFYIVDKSKDYVQVKTFKVTELHELLTEYTNNYEGIK